MSPAAERVNWASGRANTPYVISINFQVYRELNWKSKTIRHRWDSNSRGQSPMADNSQASVLAGHPGNHCGTMSPRPVFVRALSRKQAIERFFVQVENIALKVFVLWGCFVDFLLLLVDVIEISCRPICLSVASRRWDRSDGRKVKNVSRDCVSKKVCLRGKRFCEKS